MNLPVLDLVNVRSNIKREIAQILKLNSAKKKSKEKWVENSGVYIMQVNHIISSPIKINFAPTGREIFVEVSSLLPFAYFFLSSFFSNVFFLRPIYFPWSLISVCIVSIGSETLLISVCIVSVGSETLLPHHLVPVEGKPRVQTSNRIFHLQARM